MAPTTTTHHIATAKFSCCAAAFREHPGVVTQTVRQSDAALLRRYRASQDEDAFARLVSRHAAAVRQTALRNTGNAAAAEDVAQATFLVLIGRTGPALRSAKLRGDLRPWLTKTCRFCAANWRRSEHRRRRRERSTATPESVDPSQPGELAEQVASAVASLRRRDRRLIELRHLDGLAWPDVARQVGLDAPAARVAGGRALDRLRTVLTRRGITATTATVTAGLSSLIARAATRTPAPTPAAYSLAKGTLIMLKLKTTALLSTAALLALGGAGGGLLYAGQESASTNTPPEAAETAEPRADDRMAGGLLGVTLTDGTIVNLVAIGDGERWWTPLGQELDAAPFNQPLPALQEFGGNGPSRLKAFHLVYEFTREHLDGAQVVAPIPWVRPPEPDRISDLNERIRFISSGVAQRMGREEDDEWLLTGTLLFLADAPMAAARVEVGEPTAAVDQRLEDGSQVRVRLTHRQNGVGTAPEIQVQVLSDFPLEHSSLRVAELLQTGDRALDGYFPRRDSAPHAGQFQAGPATANSLDPRVFTVVEQRVDRVSFEGLPTAPLPDGEAWKRSSVWFK